MGKGACHFSDRAEAGKKLADALSCYAEKADVLILALPRGGVPVAYQIARALAAPLDVWLVRKLGVPGREELAMGAIAGNDIHVLNHEIIRLLNIDQGLVDTVIVRERAELERRNRLYREGRSAPLTEGKKIILVDDGLATGATMRAAVAAVRHAGAARIIVAAPVGAASACRTTEKEADELVCLCMPEPFYGVGQWYEDFSQTSDEEVMALLSRASSRAEGNVDA